MGCVEGKDRGFKSEMKLERVEYADLSPKQKEVYNFQQVAWLLAGYGFNCIKLDDDWQGADFLAYHKDGEQTLKVQLKARVSISKKYLGKDLYMAFPIRRRSQPQPRPRWYLVPHDKLVAIAQEETTWMSSLSWTERGSYSSDNPSRAMLGKLSGFALDDVT